MLTPETSPRIWTGTVWHDRRSPSPHQFQYRMWWADLDLGDLAEVSTNSRVLSHRPFRPLRFRRADHLGDPSRPLDEAVRDLIEQRTGDRPDGSIRLLAHLRTFGWCFNPIALYLCHDRAGSLRWIIADVTNTPWGERHQYVLPATVNGVSEHLETKTLHVSPFMGMDQQYRFNIELTGDHLSVRIDTIEDAENLFSAGVELRSRPMTDAALLCAMVRHPLLTMRVSLGIRTHAIRLWHKRVPIHRQPKRVDQPTREVTR